jgi:peptidoglycan hydrolase-like protein with peptidoglycan-binding domain
LIQGAQVGHGKKGDAVRAAQTLLNKFGASLNVDGNFGPQTVAAVKDFQSGHGLAADGIVGPQTWQALVGY